MNFFKKKNKKKSAESSSNGYVKAILTTTVPDECKSQLNSYPNTPQHNWQSPDDHTRDTASVQR